MAAFSLSAFKIRLISSILKEVFSKNTPLDRAYADHFRKIKLESDEQALIIRLVNDLIRRLNYYTYIAGYKKVKDMKNHINALICALHVEHKWPVPKNLPDTEKFSEKVAKIRKAEAQEDEMLKYGIPHWLDHLCRGELGEVWNHERKFISSEPNRYIRINTLRATVAEAKAALTSENVKFAEVEGIPEALVILGNAPLFRTKAFKDGLFEQQDLGSQQIAPFVKAAPGRRVIDACAGAGGKTLHLAALMKGRGTLIAMDDKEWKLEALKERARRDGAYNIETRHIDSSKVIKRLHNKADCVLLDVPCSGLGVLKRNFDTKWQDRTAEINELKQIQAQIIDSYSQMTIPGGILVYSTCSILPSENEKQVANFLEKHPDFVLEEERHVLPSAGGDGFYMARMKRLTAKELEAKDQNSVEATTVETETEGEALASTANDAPLAVEAKLKY